MPLSARPSSRAPFRLMASSLTAALAAATLVVGLPAPATAVPSTGLMISEFYPGGGNTSATYNADFVELYNASNQAVSLAGKSLQYRSSTSTSVPSGSNVFALPDVKVPAKGYFLVKGAVGAVGVEIPKTPDAFSSLGMGGSAGQVYLADSAVGINPVVGAGSVALGGTIDYSPGKVIDFVGYGTGATSYETALKSGAITTAQSYKRAATPVDSDNNNSDFTISAVAPGPDNCDCVAPVLKVTEVYADGGSAGAAYDHDFVEIYNPGSSAVVLDGRGLTLQYRAPGDTGPATVVAPLTGTIGAGSYDIALLGTSGSEGAAVPGVDYTVPGIDLSAAGGTLFIAKSTGGFDPGTGAVPSSQFVSDLVGWGTANAFEGSPADAAASPADSLSRAAGAVDTGVNLDDLTGGTPNPNAAPVVPTRSIPEIQGTGATTPLNNAQVTTVGVVTAAYPRNTGDFAGFYLQTPGYDPANDATPQASDGIFVYTGSAAIAPSVGDKVQVTGKVTEFGGMTELTVGATGFTNLGPASAAEQVTPATVVPGTDCALPGDACLTGAALEAARESHEGELFQPTGPTTVSDSYDGTPWTQSGTRGFQMAGEIGLALGSEEPLMVPTEVVSPSDAAGLAARNAYNAAHMITLDDGANIDYSTGTNRNVAFPWLTPTHTVRVGAAVTFPKPVVLDYRNSLWKLQPQGKVTGDGESFVSIEQDRQAAPEDVLGATGDLKIATFNMLNYFNTTGEDWDTTTARRCTYYTDRQSNRITVDTCEETDSSTTPATILPGPRGAANQTNFLRQEAKELEAINAIDADVMSLEEVENSIKIGDPDRDDALRRLVEQLNLHWAAAHPESTTPRWAFVPSPRAAAQPTVLEQDAIRSAFIYDPSTVQPLGVSRILVNSAPFRNAREPLAQAFTPVGGGRANSFAVIVNHFKSKGDSSGTASGDNLDKGDGAGFYNGDRKRQAAALLAFANQFLDDRGIEAAFLSGDFNAYAMEDPIRVLTDAGYHDLHPANNEKTYSFGGLAGSLDHVLANDAAHAMVTGEDVWSINANEPVFYEYSRYNTNLTDLYAVNPFRSSDHNPEIIGIDTGALVADPDRDVVQVLATNDFHGRILDNPGSAEAGAASLAGAVKTLRSQNPDTVFAAAGDLVGASTFESFVAHDKPTIDALNEAGLEVSAAGNHEFDSGYRDLVDRIMAPYDAETNPYGGAGWEYIASNVRFKSDHSAALPEKFETTLPGGHTVGFVGAVTEDLPALVAGDGISEIEVTDIVESVNENADELKAPGGCGEADGCDLVIMLLHEGAATTSASALTDGSPFADIVASADADIDAIVSGHTHLAYNHKITVPAWVAEGRTVTQRPVVSAGQYGANLNRLEFEFLPGTDDLVNIRQRVLALKDYDADPATQAIVDAAVAAAAGPGNAALGDLANPFVRAQRRDATTNVVGENRGGESTLGNLVAEIQRWKTGAEIGFMNPGGLRADLLGTDGSPRVLTYRQAADVQPFANTLVTMDLTGAQIKTILEQQWQRDADGNIPSRPFLRLGTSAGFTSTYDGTRPEGDRITGMWLDGEALVPSRTYRVSSTSFLASGTGDNFWGFAAATNRQDTGKTDLQAVVDYMGEFAEHGVDAPLAPDYGQHAVGVRFPAGAPGTYAPGDTLAFDLSSLAMTGASDTQDGQIEVLLDGASLGTFPVDNALATTPYDEAGRASVSAVLPAGLKDGRTTVVVRGLATGTEVLVPIRTTDGLPDTTVSGADQQVELGQPGTVPVSVDPTSATGTVTLLDGPTVVGTTTLTDGTGEIALPAGGLGVGSHVLDLAYSGDAGHSPSTGSVTVTVVKATPVVTATPTPASVEVNKETSSLEVTVSATGVEPTGTVSAVVDGQVVDTAALTAGAATLTVGPFATVGDQPITVDYSGDGQTRTGSTDTSVTVTAPVPPPLADTTTTASAQPMVYGTDGSVEVSVVSAKPDTRPVGGAVQVSEGDIVLASGTVGSDGQAVLPLSGTALSTGQHTLVVSYLGGEATKPSETAVSLTVSKASSSTTASISPAQVVVYDGKVTVSSSVSAAGFTPTGQVEVLVDGAVAQTVALVDGAATADLGPFTTVGSRSVSVRYTGDATTAGSTSAATSFSVVKATPTMSLTVQPSRITTKSKVTLGVAMTAPGQLVTGRVTVVVNGVLRSAMLVNGSASFNLGTFTTARTYQVQVSYGGSATVRSVSKTTSFVVYKR